LYSVLMSRLVAASNPNACHQSTLQASSDPCSARRSVTIHR
jgi:hypothetical protein